MKHAVFWPSILDEEEWRKTWRPCGKRRLNTQYRLPLNAPAQATAPMPGYFLKTPLS